MWRMFRVDIKSLKWKISQDVFISNAPNLARMFIESDNYT